LLSANSRFYGKKKQIIGVSMTKNVTSQ